ncbi:MAG: GWxTD domain-containing protein [Candidatus Zixiibacteriota bacterium]
MKKAIIIMIFLLTIPIIHAQIYPNFNSQRSKFSMMYTWRPIFEKGEDSKLSLDEGNVMMKVYYFVPYSVLAFQRKDGSYNSEYTLRSALYQNSRLISGNSESSRFKVQDYSKTGNNELFLKDSIEFKAPVGSFELFVGFDDKIAGQQMKERDIIIDIDKFSQKIDMTKPLILDKFGNIKMSNLRLDDTVHYSIGIIAPESDDVKLRVKIKKGRDIQYSSVDTLLARERTRAKNGLATGQSARKIRFPIETGRYFIYNGSFCVCGEKDIDGGDKEFIVQLKNIPKNKTAEKSIMARFHASYSNMTSDDFSKEVYLLSIIGKNREVKKIKKASPQERDSLIEEFWAKRDPNPSTKENEFKEEFLRRVRYANDHFSGWKPGYKTDRGRIYIEYGPPDEIEQHPFETGTYPYIKWYYYSLQRVYTFVDKHGNGDYTLWSID